MNGTGQHHRPFRAALVLVGVGVLLLLLGLLIGSGRFEWPWGGDAPPILADIVWSIRAPRSAGAWAAGALLGLAGAIAQGIFRNPLADPYLLGSSSGAALAVALSLSVLSAWAHTPDAKAYIAPFLAFGLTGVAFVGGALGRVFDRWFGRRCHTRAAFALRRRGGGRGAGRADLFRGVFKSSGIA